MGEGSGPAGDAMVPQKIDGNPLKKKGTSMAKYNAFELNSMKAKGQCFPGGTSYPIADGEDLDNAIHAVGRGNADHDAIRKYIAGRAKALGMSSKIPANWGADGSITPDGRSSTAPVTVRAEPHDTLYADLNPATWKTVADGEELDAAIASVGDGASFDHGRRRVYLMAQAASLGLADHIPNNWGTDGNITEVAPRSDVGLEQAGFIRERFFAAGDLEIRSDGRTLYGMAVPFDQVATVNDGRGDYDEMFKRGSFARTIAGNAGQRVKLMANHDSKRFPVGRATMLREDNAGLVGEFHVSATRDGDEVLQLAKDKVLDSFSVGFTGIRHQRNNQGVVERHEVALREVSVVAFPSYAGAAIGGVRHLLGLLREDPDTLTPAELEELAKYLNTYRSDGTPFTTSGPAEVGTSEVIAEPPTEAPALTQKMRRERVARLFRRDI